MSYTLNCIQIKHEGNWYFVDLVFYDMAINKVVTKNLWSCHTYYEALQEKSRILNEVTND